MRSVQPPENESLSVDWRARIADQAVRPQRAEDEHRTAATQLAEALHQAHAEGMSWTAIADAAGLANADTARTRAQRGKSPDQRSPSIRWRSEHGAAPRPKVEPPGLSITDAAKRLGISRVTVYDWIKAGKLRTAKDASGRQRVLFED